MADVPTLTVSPDCLRLALCGGPYSNFAAVEAFLATTKTVTHRFCLGDIGGFGPRPNLTLDLIRQAGVMCIQGNYDDAIGNGARDCGCGYSDERDRRFAQISYDYTYDHTAIHHRDWLQTLPQQMRIAWGDRSVLLCHGSPDRVNEFVWETETSDEQICDYLLRYGVDGICVTHSGLPWVRQVVQADGRLGFWFNVGVLGRPANNGQRHVHYGLLERRDTEILPRLMTLDYDVSAVATAMRAEGLPEEFAESLETGIWTTCAEILPPTEQAACALIYSAGQIA
ncbi:MAG: metallophosphoesterase [Cyanobacteria bacterium P01_A01_bin.123]